MRRSRFIGIVRSSAVASFTEFLAKAINVVSFRSVPDEARLVVLAVNDEVIVDVLIESCCAPLRSACTSAPCARVNC